MFECMELIGGYVPQYKTPLDVLLHLFSQMLDIGLSKATYKNK